MRKYKKRRKGMTGRTKMATGYMYIGGKRRDKIVQKYKRQDMTKEINVGENGQQKRKILKDVMNF